MTDVNNLTFLLVYVSCLITTVFLTRICLMIARRTRFMDQPDQRKVHDSPIPYLGGPAILLGCFLPLIVIVPTELILQFFAASAIVALIGLVDDYRDVNALTKLIVLFAAVLVASRVGLVSQFFPDTLTGTILDTLLTLFWVILVISAFNASDNMDGLAPGFGTIACLMFFIIGGVQFYQPQWALVSIAMVGTLTGFLLFNFHPAVIFLGDSGSFFLGFFLAILGVMGDWSTHPLKAMIIPVVILSVPILDLVFLVLYRYLTGVTDSIKHSIEYSATDHLSHRVQNVRNFGTRRTVLILYTLATCVGLLGVIMRNTHPLEAVIALVLVGLLYGLVILLLLPNLKQIYWRWQES